MECKLIANVVVLAEDRVLLVKHKELPDSQNGWFCPDDLLRHLEHPDDAARRILREQVGIDVEVVRLGQIESFKGRDGSWHLVFDHLVRLDSIPTVSPSAALEVAEWFALDDLPEAAEVAHHGWALDVIRKLVGQPD